MHAAIVLALLAADPAPAPHALILARTAAEKAFVPEAAALLVERKLTPITLDELNALLDVERVKDLAGCTDVACVTEIGGAYGVRYFATIKASGERAVVAVHDRDNLGKVVAQQIVSHESAAQALMRSIDGYNAQRDRTVAILRQVPCGFPWKDLHEALGEPHTVDEKERVTHYGYFDIDIVVKAGRVYMIEGGDALACK